MCAHFIKELESLNVKTHPWRVARAAELVIEFREKFASLSVDATAPGAPRIDKPEA
jgi:hypothetical protein